MRTRLAAAPERAGRPAKTARRHPTPAKRAAVKASWFYSPFQNCPRFHVLHPSTSERQRTTDEQNPQHQRTGPEQDKDYNRRNLDKLHERIARRFSVRRERSQ